MNFRVAFIIHIGAAGSVVEGAGTETDGGRGRDVEKQIRNKLNENRAKIESDCGRGAVPSSSLSP